MLGSPSSPAVALFFIGNYAIELCARLFHLRTIGAGALLPRDQKEAAVFFAVSLSAGFCEEVVFRGYLQRQFHSVTRSALLAILLQAVVFGVSHGYQGIDAMLRITVYGIFFGLTTHLCKSILPTILTHAWQDVFSGIIQRWSSIL